MKLRLLNVHCESQGAPECSITQHESESLQGDIQPRTLRRSVSNGRCVSLTAKAGTSIGESILARLLAASARSDEPCRQTGHRRWRTNGEPATLLLVVLRTCTVAVKDVRDVEHSIEVTAETLYEAIATALAALQKDNWVGEIGQGFTTVTVVVQQPPVKHEVKMKDFVSWLGRQGRSPAEVILKQKLEKILGKVNHART